MRIAFIPPPVDPTQPPMKLKSNSITGKNPGQLENDVVVYPVVVAIDIAWNAPTIKLSLAEKVALKIK